MVDNDYWKHNYSGVWDESSSREQQFKELIEKETGLTLEPYGLGAGTTNFIHGSATDNDNEKGSADFHVIGTNIYIEVTRSLSPRTKAGDDIWIRPDKIENARIHFEDHDTFIANNFKYAGEWYVIHYTKECDAYFEEMKKRGTDCKIIKPTIRGNLEKYISISSNNPYVKGLDSLIEYLNNVNKRQNFSQEQKKNTRCIKR